MDRGSTNRFFATFAGANAGTQRLRGSHWGRKPLGSDLEQRLSLQSHGFELRINLSPQAPPRSQQRWALLNPLGRQLNARAASVANRIRQFLTAVTVALERKIHHQRWLAVVMSLV